MFSLKCHLFIYLITIQRGKQQCELIYFPIRMAKDKQSSYWQYLCIFLRWFMLPKFCLFCTFWNKKMSIHTEALSHRFPEDIRMAASASSSSYSQYLGLVLLKAAIIIFCNTSLIRRKCQLFLLVSFHVADSSWMVWKEKDWPPTQRKSDGVFFSSKYKWRAEFTSSELLIDCTWQSVDVNCHSWIEINGITVIYTKKPLFFCWANASRWEYSLLKYTSHHNSRSNALSQPFHCRYPSTGWEGM